MSIVTTTLQAIASVFGRSLVFENFDGTGRMNPRTGLIQLNPAALEAEARDVLDSQDLKARASPYLEEARGLFGQNSSLIERAVNLDAFGTLCHEIAHGTEGLTMEQIVLLYAALRGPEALKHYLNNVCGDVRDQGRFGKKYPGKWFRLGLKFIQEATQGDIQGYKKSLGGPGWDPIQGSLWYFILRGWNELDIEITSLFGHHPALPWQPDTLEAFDAAIHTASNEAYIARFKALYPLVLRDLRAQNPEPPKGPGRSGGDSGDPKDGGTPGQDPQDGETPQQGQSDRGQSGQGQSIDDQIDAGAQALLALMDVSQGVSAAVQRSMQNYEQSCRSQILQAASNLRSWPLSHATPKPLPDWAIELYNNCMAWWGQLMLTPARETRHRLMSGELDESRCEQWILERDLRIFQRDRWNRQERHVLIHFVLDESGSMAGTRRQAAEPLVAAMAHAFEMSGFPTEVLLFASHSGIVKTPEEQSLLSGPFSDILGTIQGHQGILGSSTEPAAAYEWLQDTAREDIDHVVFYITDGQIPNRQAASVKKIIENLTATGRWQFKALAIDLSKEELDSLTADMSPGEVWKYTAKEISTKLGVDIYNFFTEEFISLDE